jgi:hypothetical protein
VSYKSAKWGSKGAVVPLLYSMMVCILSIWYGCSGKTVRLDVLKTIDWPSFEKGSSAYQYFEAQNKGYAVAFDQRKENLQVFDLRQPQHPTFVVPLTELPSVYTLYTRHFLVDHLDAFVLLAKRPEDPSKNYRHVLFINRKGELINAYDLNILDTNVNTYALYPNSESRILFRDSALYLFKMHKSETSTASGRATRYAQAAELRLDISTSPPKVNATTGWFPEQYLNNDYHDYWPSRCFNAAGELVYSFGASHDIGLQLPNGKVKWVPCKSKYITEMRPYPAEKRDDFGFYQRYFHEEPRYYDIRFDPYRNIYYRLVKYRAAYEKADGTLSDGADIKKGIMILNDSFQLLDEVPIDDQHTSIFGITKEGFWLTQKGTMAMDLIKVTLNE